MKKILRIFVAVLTCATVLLASVVPAFAVTDEYVNDIPENIDFLDNNGDIAFSVPYEEFVLEDYVIPYDAYKGYSSTTFSVLALLGFEGGLAWSSTYAAAGLTCTAAAPYILGLLLLSGGIALLDHNGVIEDIFYNTPEKFHALVHDICSELSVDALFDLDLGFEAWTQKQPIIIPQSLSLEVSNAINAMQTTDGAGNPVDTTIVVDQSIIGGAFVETLPSSIPMPYGEQLFFKNNADVVDGNYSATVGGLTFTQSFDGRNSYYTLSNALTGSSVNIGNLLYQYYKGWWTTIDAFSKLYLYDPADGTAPYWIMYSMANTRDWQNGNFVDSSARLFNFLDCTAERPITFNGTGTSIDGLKITSVVWNTISEKWNYTDSDGKIHDLPIDPGGLLLSNTGVGVAPGDGITTSPNESDRKQTLPFIPPVPHVGSAKDNLIGVPITDDIGDLTTPVDDTTDGVEAGTRVEEAEVDLGSKNNITAFISGLPDFVSHLFDWLPDQFRNSLNGVLTTFEVIVLLMIGVKIFDILWP